MSYGQLGEGGRRGRRCEDDGDDDEEEEQGEEGGGGGGREKDQQGRDNLELFCSEVQAGGTHYRHTGIH